jgi:NAD(P)-dependent dehydrogenase (short-subunit alcohol dehydrogenase family)
MNAGAFPGLSGKVAVITGGGGLIGAALAEALADAGVRVAILDRSEERAARLAEALRTRSGGAGALGVVGDVLDRASLDAANDRIRAGLGPVDLLVNCAGGNAPEGTTAVEFLEPDLLGSLERTFFGLDVDGFRKVFDLNVLGTVLPTLVFARDMVGSGGGVILNVSSMNAFRPLTRIPAYSAAKASVNNFTEWLAVHFAKVNVRVNAIAPGFLLTNQNRFLLLDDAGGLTPRGGKILASTPMGAFGSPEDLQGPALFLLSDLSRFVTGVVLPVDGGFNAYSGV